MGTVNENIKISMVDAFSQGLVKLNSGIEGNQKRMEQFAGAAKTAAAGLTAFAGTQAALNLLDSAKNWGNAIDEIQDKTGLSGKAASELLVISNTVGLANDEMGNAIMKMSKSAATAREAILSARDAGKESTDVYSSWGIKILDANDNLLDADQILRNVTQRHREMADGTAKNAMEQDLFGKSGGKLKDMLDLTDERIAEFIKHAQKAGLIMGDEFSPKMEKLTQDTNLLKLQFEGLKIQLGMQLMPEFINMEKKAQDVIDTYGQLDSETKNLITNSLEAGIVIAGIGASMNALIWLGAPFKAFADIVAAGLDKIAVRAGIARAALVGPIGVAALLVGGSYVAWQDEMDYASAGGQYTYDDEGIGTRTNEYITPFYKNYDTSYAKGYAKRNKQPETKESNTNPYSGGKTHVSDTSSADSVAKAEAAAAKKAEEDYKRMIERYNKLMAELNEKIVDETGTEFDKVVARTDTEIAKMQEDVVKIQAQGIDTSALTERINAYRQVMMKKAEEARRDEQIKLYQDTLSRSAMMIELEQGTNDQMNIVRMQQLADYEAFLRKELESTELNVEDRLALERDLADAIQQQHEITAQNIVGGWNQAVEQLKNYSYDYEEHFTSMFDDMGNSMASMWDGVVDDNKSVGESIKDTWNDVSNTIIKAIWKAAMEMYVVKPMFSWLSGMFGLAGNTISSGNDSGFLVSSKGTYSLGAHADGGQASGWSIVGEHGKELVNFSDPARVYSANQTQAMLASNSQPALQLNIHNNTGSEVKSEKTNATFDGAKWVIDVVLDAVDRNVGGFRNNMKTALSG